MLGVKILVGCEVIRNSGCGFAKHIGHDGIQRHIADGKGILKAVFLAASHRCELIAVTSQFAEDADILVRDKTAFHQANAKQISNPFGVLGIILVTLYSFDPFGVCDDNTNAPLFQDIEHRNPILSGGLHTDIQTVILMEPVGKAVQVRVKCRKAFLLITGLQTILLSFDDGCHQKRFVNVNPTAGWKYDFQIIPSSSQNCEEKAVTEPPGN